MAPLSTLNPWRRGSDYISSIPGASVVGAGVDAVTTSDEESRARREREQRQWEREQRRCERRQQQGKTC